MNERIETKDVIEIIRAAFAGVPRGEITLHEAEALDSYRRPAEVRRARAHDTESAWQDIPDASIQACQWALPHFDPVSWRYHIPAFMTWTLRHGGANEAMVANFTLFSLDGGREPDDHNRARFELLDAAQRRAVCMFLRCMATDRSCARSSAEQALSDYWERFG